MGVRSLQSYLEKSCSSAIPKKNIKELAERRRQSPNEELIIVVDAVYFIGKQYQDLELDWIGGVQFNQFAQETKKFVDAFRKIGIRLVFFYDGPKVEKKRDRWVEKRMDKLSKTNNVLDQISYGASSASIGHRGNFVLPGGFGQHSRLIFEVFCVCEVHQSILECDEEIAEYAKKHNVFGVLAHDTDFVIMDIGQALYLDLEYLDVKSMMTRVYYPAVLARQLGLQISQFPVLATLMGTDIIRFEDSKRFHLSFARTRNPNVLVPKLASMVKYLTRGNVGVNEISKQISKKMFNNVTQAGKIKNSIDSFKTVIRPAVLHEADPPPFEEKEAMWSWLLEESRQRHMKNLQPDCVNAIMNGGPLESGNSLEDYRLDDLPLFVQSTRKIRQRLYGILLQQKPKGPRAHEVAEWIMAGPGSLNGPKYNRAVLPDPPHPGLAVLWGEDESFDDIRWSLFVRSVSPRLDVESVRSLPPRMIIPTMILYTIVHLEDGVDWLEPWEVAAVLATAAVLPHYSPQQLAALPPDPLTSRSVRVANLLMRSTFIYYGLQTACGLPVPPEATAPWTFFDGKLLQTKYRKAQKCSDVELCDNRDDCFQDFENARRVIFGNM